MKSTAVRQGVKQLGWQVNRTGRSNLPRKIKLEIETCSGQTWLSNTLSLSILSTVHSSFPNIFSFLRTSAWPLVVTLGRWSQLIIKALSLQITKSSCHHFHQISNWKSECFKQQSETNPKSLYNLKLLAKNLGLNRKGPRRYFSPFLSFVFVSFLNTTSLHSLCLCYTLG